jgi:hypothetical protein
MWMPPKALSAPQTWDEYFQDWIIWAKQVGMNVWWGRGGLNVKVRVHVHDIITAQPGDLVYGRLF